MDYIILVPGDPLSEIYPITMSVNQDGRHSRNRENPFQIVVQLEPNVNQVGFRCFKILKTVPCMLKISAVHKKCK